MLLDSLNFLVVDDAAARGLSFSLQHTPSSMPDAGKKRSYDEELRRTNRLAKRRGGMATPRTVRCTSTSPVLCSQSLQGR